MRLPLLTPSVARRTLVTLSIAAIGVLLVLIAYDYWEFNTRALPQMEQQMQLVCHSITNTLGDVQNEEQARVVVAGIANLIADLDAKSESPQYGTYLQLRDVQGRVIYEYPKSFKVQLSSTGQVLQEQTIEGKSFHVFQSQRDGWMVILAHADVHFSSFIVKETQELAFNVLLALPFLFFPVWWAVAQGLRPLTVLSRHVEQRDPNDLSLIEIDIQQSELKPIVLSINGLLSKLGKKLAQEKAFIHDAAHELQTPLANVLGEAHVLMYETDETQRNRAFQQLEYGISRTSHLIRQLLQLDRLDTLMTAEQVNTDITRLTRECLMLHSREAVQKNIELTLHAEDNLMMKIVPHAFLSIIDNLISNALRYIPVNSHIEITLKHHEGWLHLSVADDGPGIPESEHELVFNRFYRGRSEVSSGSGLGLAIVKQAAAGLGGSVSLKAGTGDRGCLFEVLIPDCKAL